MRELLWNGNTVHYNLKQHQLSSFFCWLFVGLFVKWVTKRCHLISTLSSKSSISDLNLSIYRTLSCLQFLTRAQQTKQSLTQQLHFTVLLSRNTDIILSYKEYLKSITSSYCCYLLSIVFLLFLLLLLFHICWLTFHSSQVEISI